MMTLYHHTTIWALKSIYESGKIIPIDYVWMTENPDGEMTAGMMFADVCRGRVEIDIPENFVFYVNDNWEMFPDLNYCLLNMITDTSLWYVFDGELKSEYISGFHVLRDGEWIDYELIKHEALPTREEVFKSFPKE